MRLGISLFEDPKAVPLRTEVESESFDCRRADNAFLAAKLDFSSFAVFEKSFYVH